MFSYLTRVLSVLSIALIIVSCANRGSPSGGEKDVDPPVILVEEPANFSTEFKADEIIITFDEYVKIKDIRKQLIISPPMDIDPVIYPSGGASKFISIKIKDTLRPNTTYAFNFGESIVDNNEGNPYPYYRYVFSTGTSIDSLSVKGYVEDALLKTPDSYISVMLYEVDANYTDSIVYKEKPRYITNTLDSLTSFSIDNVKAGTYKLVALKDKKGNYKFDQKEDKIGFYESHIVVPTTESHRLVLFNETPNFKAYKPKQIAAQRLIFPYEGSYEQMRISVLGETPADYKTRITKAADSDTLYYWYQPDFKVDTTFFVVRNQKYIDTFKHRFRNLEKDSLIISVASNSTLESDKTFTIEGTVPFAAIDATKIKLIDKDSLPVDFTIDYDSISNRYHFPFKKQLGLRYSFTMLPETFRGFYGQTNKDTLRFNFRTKMESEYGNMRVNLRNAKLPLIVQLVDAKGKVHYEYYADTSPVVDFFNIIPKLYDLRAVHDANANGKYDTGDYLLGVQPERVSYAPKIDEVRANFDNIIEFTLLD